MKLESGAAAYLLGRGGATKRRLSNFSGATLEIDPKDDCAIVQIFGTPREKALAKMCIDITLQQRNGGRMVVDFETLERRDDVVTLDVPSEAVGFVLGSRGATLRELETRFRTFMFFNNDKNAEGKKRLYILGEPSARRSALRECEKAVEYKMGGEGDRQSWRDRRRSRSPPRHRRRSPSPYRRRSPSPRRRRSPSPHRRRSPSPARRRDPSPRRRSPSPRREPRDYR